MNTPADGASPCMQMYVFTPSVSAVTVNSGPLAGVYNVGVADYGPQSFNVTNDIVFSNDGAGADTHDGCEPITNVSGKIAFINRGNCNFSVKTENAQNGRAVGVIIANVSTSANPATPPGMTGTPTITIIIGTMSLNVADGDAFRNQFGIPATVNGTMTRGAATNRDGTIDNQVMAHEWGHYISNRLIGNASGISNNQGGSMGEGGGDFHSMLMTVRAEDAAVASNTNYNGVYAMAGYALGNGANNSYYFGIRRVPYSTDLTKNPLTFKHISDGQPITGAPIAFGADGGTNSEVHNSGEVWATMLWEYYASLLRDTLGGSPRLTFNIWSPPTR